MFTIIMVALFIYAPTNATANIPTWVFAQSTACDIAAFFLIFWKLTILYGSDQQETEAKELAEKKEEVKEDE